VCGDEDIPVVAECDVERRIESCCGSLTSVAGGADLTVAGNGSNEPV